MMWVIYNLSNILFDLYRVYLYRVLMLLLITGRTGRDAQSFLALMKMERKWEV